MPPKQKPITEYKTWAHLSQRDAFPALLRLVIDWFFKDDCAYAWHCAFGVVSFYLLMDECAPNHILKFYVNRLKLIQ